MPPCRTRQIGGGAERRVGGERRVAVRAAALQGQHELGGGPRLAPGRGRDRAPCRGSPHSIAATVFRVPPVSWMVRVRKVSLLLEAVLLLHAADLEHLAAEADHDHAGEIRVAGVAPLGAAQDLEPLAVGGVAAARAVDDGHDAVDVRIVARGGPTSPPPPRRSARRRRSSSRRSGCRCSCACRSCPRRGGSPRRSPAPPRAGDRPASASSAEVVVAGEVVQADIVLMHPLARRDVDSWRSR